MGEQTGVQIISTEESLLYGHEQAGQDAEAEEGGDDRDDSKEKMTFES